MKPSDKAYAAARAEGKRWETGSYYSAGRQNSSCHSVLRQDGENGAFDVVAEFNNHKERDEALERLRAEAMVDAAYAAQFHPSEDYAGLVKQLRNWGAMNYQICDEAADTLKAVLAERDDFAEQLALRSESSMAKDMQEIMRVNNELVAERDAANGRVYAAELHAAGMSTQRDIAIRERDALKDLLPNQNHEGRAPIPTDWWSVAVLERRKRRAAEKERDALLARLAPVDDYNLEIMAAKEFIEATTDMPPRTTYTISKRSLSGARNVIAAIRPHIEAAEREQCAKIADDCDKSTHPADVAAAIRRGK